MPIPGVTEYPGVLPDINDPTTFNARMTDYTSWFTTSVSEISDVVDALNIALNGDETVLDATAAAVRIATNAGTKVVTSGIGDAYEITPAVAVAALSTSSVFLLSIDRENTGPVTLEVMGSSDGAVAVLKNVGGSIVSLEAGDWQAGDVHMVSFNGSQFELISASIDDILEAAKTSAELLVSGISVAPDVVLEDQKPQGSAGGGAISGSALIREINTVVRDTGSLNALSGNEFSFSEAGWLEWQVPGFRVGTFKSWLFNVSDGVIVGRGTSARSGGGVSVTSMSVGGAAVETGKLYRLEMQVETTRSTEGFGPASNFGPEVFSRAKYWRAS